MTKLFSEVRKRLFCFHHWTSNIMSRPVSDARWVKVGLRDWRTGESWFGCYKCGKVKCFPYNFIPVNYEAL